MNKIASDVRDMREKIAAQNPTDNPWELKHVRGGLIDIEFIAQYLQLIHAHEHPEILSVHTETALQNAAGMGLIGSEHAETLLHAIRLMHNLTQVARICVEGAVNPDEATPSFRQLLSRVAAVPDFSVLQADLVETERKVLEAFNEIVAISGAAG